MKWIYCLLMSFSFCSPLVVSAQIKVKTMNPDGTPNSNCYFSVDSVQIGLANRNGYVFIDEKFKGEEVAFTDLDSGWGDRFILKSDTTIVFEEVQILSEVEIKPRNTKKLYKEIMELNQNRLPEKLNLKGEVFMSELYIIKDLKSEGRVDTIIDFFKCDIIILDVFGRKSILAKDPRNYRDGSAENEGYFSEVKNISNPLSNFNSVINKLLNFEIFEMKKFRKHKSSFNIDDGLRELKFFKEDTSRLILESMRSEYLYIWDKEDSMLNRVSHYYEQLGRESSTSFSVPFGFTEFSNYNHDYTQGHVLSESEIEIYNPENNKHVVNNSFIYFYFEKKVEADEVSKGYKEVESLQSLFEETKQKKPDEDIILVLYPLRFPISIFF